MVAVTICSGFGAPKIKSDTVSTVSPSISHEVMGPDAMIFVFWMLSFKPTFHSPLSLASRGYFVLLHLLPKGWYHLHIWSYWYFSQQSWLQLGIHPAWHFTWCTLHISWINRVTLHSLAVFLSQFGTSASFHFWFWLLLLDLPTGFTGDSHVLP